MKKKTVFVAILLAILLFSNGRFSVGIATWISTAMLLFGARRLSATKGFLFAWTLLTLAWTFQFHGMVPVPTTFYVLIAVTYGLIAALPYLVDGLLIRRPKRFLDTLIFPSAWAFVDYLTVFTPYGSWGLTAYSQHDHLVLLQSISVFGMGFITFLIGWFASVVNWAIENELEWPKVRLGAAAFAAVMVLTLGFGGVRLALRKPSGDTVRVASLSAIAKGDQKRSAGLEARMFSNQLTDEDKAVLQSIADAQNSDLFERSAREAEAGAKIIFWGEANASAFKTGEPALLDRAARFARQHEVYLGLSAAVLNLGADKPLENKLVLFSPEGRVLFDYWKANPVPGGEAMISAVKGRELPVVDTDFGKLGGAICFDMDFPDFLKQASDADMLIAPSNDWRAIDPWHTHMARYRAIEQGFNLIRHTSNGLSVGTDFTGRVISRMDHYGSNDRVLVTQLPTRGVTTVYSVIGDAFAWFCLVLLVGIPLHSRTRS